MANLYYLYELRKVLNDINPSEFDWNVWYDENNVDCGTQACVAGWGALKSQMLQQAGLYLQPSDSTLIFEVNCQGSTSGPVRFANMFRISIEEAEALFYGDGQDCDDYPELKKELYCLRDDLDLDKAKRVLDIIIKRHELLRP